MEIHTENTTAKVTTDNVANSAQSSPVLSKAELSNAELRERFVAVVTKYVNERKEKKSKIRKASEIYHYIQKLDDFKYLKKPTFYRHLKNLTNIVQYNPGSSNAYFDFAPDESNALYTFPITFDNYNKWLHISTAPHCSSFISQIINDTYGANLLHCVAIHDTIIIFYHWTKTPKKNDVLGKTYLTSDYLKESLPLLLASMQVNQIYE